MYTDDTALSKAIYVASRATRHRTSTHRSHSLTDDPGKDQYPAWSPDGRDIVFASDRGGDYDLYRLTLGSAALQNLTNNLAQDASPAFAPDGTLLLFDSNREGNYELYVLDLSTLAVTRLTNNSVFDADPAWQP